MGHQHLGVLPRSRNWSAVVQLISGGAAADEIAGAASKAAEANMVDASNDPAVRHAFWFLTQIPLAARANHFASALRELGLEVSSQPTLIEIASELTSAVDRELSANGRSRTDFGEMAQLCAAESLCAVAGRELDDLVDSVASRTGPVLAGLATPKQFTILARDFFSRLTRRHLGYYLSRELSSHVGMRRRFSTVREHQAFEEALDQHCREASRVVKEYSGQWFVKHVREDGIDPRKAGAFVHVASKKIREELRYRRGANG